jgi:hypothetical protein
MFPLNRPELSDVIDASIGEGSPFHEMFGYYAQGVDERTATLPQAWRDRLVGIDNPNTRGIAGLCLEIIAGIGEAQNDPLQPPHGS